MLNPTVPLSGHDPTNYYDQVVIILEAKTTVGVFVNS